MNQNTICHSISCIGKGVHSGLDVKMILHPAPENHGIKFKRNDLNENNIIEAKFENVSHTVLNTTISNTQGIKVSTVEHVMAALWGCGIDNCLIEIDNEEVPIMDGSSEHFVFMIESAGTQEQEAKRKFIKINKTIKVGDDKAYIEIEPADDLSINLQINFTNQIIGKQDYAIHNQVNSFKHDLSRARTFCFEYEVEALRKKGLAKGGSLDNAIIVSQDKILNENGLRFDDEFVRHKVLDCIGDLYLAGHIKAKVKGYCSGHKLNNELLREVFKDQEAWHEILS
ncbi:UDP-3-O-acyl-N-acetylglucosamine deacetylase [Rickettsiales endosymbiont of Stachyamoeba lipophora]|uniref:UDP-3-O-acyl-N-acetylglucosamine deacetylase n=1 Tax=Rickettsiales endosymbiont of Stachyamoeba lipophora TaxID=2486578 RepID=UPI000F64A95B|nr:UDP-3-O-acyl-N-acetylglucosamine deacetylase [Rickettsiales endosymbiont of Stachyamoeba lipophora]AZL16024.1 UDP-3-O-acyl-N-acetylglucosamine deacetylase [Rickettsiales endosymbiont of Stachyamoeba lipophora]